MQPLATHAEFWRWFRDNAERIRGIMYGNNDDAREAAAEELREAVAKAGVDAILEFGPAPEGGPLELIASADGRPERVDDVKDFVASAPVLPRWRITAFRPRMELGDSIEIVIRGEKIGTSDVWFEVEGSEQGLDLTLHVRGLTPENERVRGLGGSLLAEHAVGERDALTLIGSLRALPLPNDPAAAGLRPFRDLVGVFDAERQKRYPPPGSLPLDEEGSWQAMHGMMGEKPVFILLNADLGRFAGHPDYDRSVVVTIPFNHSRPDGLPASEEEFSAVADIGDRVADVLQEGQSSLLALTMTTQGRRELVFYTSDADVALKRLATVRDTVDTHRIGAEVERDTFWGRYRSFCQAAEQKEGDEEGEQEA